MISILAVLPEGVQLEELAARHPSVEVLTAHGVEDTLEKLGRNRRVDAVLLLEEQGMAAIVAAIEEDNPAHPPLFQAAGGLRVPGTRILANAEPVELIDLLVRELES
ncbi:MAG TPA: hypothetical protein VK416_15065 [Thermoanaerobaculia bacterium]|nr:hypothetical protein [Thermoanaerobaculia bacterium]